jgi:catechol 2,3-dioxygenase-like lactoylglutathione lyase family enzyme
MLGDYDVAAAIAVSNIETGKKFYGETLGLEQASENPGGVLYKSGNSNIFVYPSPYAGTNKATYVGWSVDDVEGTIAELKEKGVQFEQYDDMPGTTRDGDVHSMGEVKAAWFKDPDGNILSFSNMMG